MNALLAVTRCRTNAEVDWNQMIGFWRLQLITTQVIWWLHRFFCFQEPQSTQGAGKLKRTSAG